jgi:aryl-alcohol dehydrogenase-like predicted oxidoreductase
MTITTRPLGATGIDVSEIGLGAWQLGAHREWNGPGERESLEIIDEALRLGCTFIDTASPYADGRSEEYIGRALEGRREQAVICTKFGFWAPGYQEDHSADRIEESVELSLRRLRTDYIDVLLFHGPPQDFGGTARHWEILRRLVHSGVIRAYGVSVGSGSSAQIRDVIETTGSQVIEVHFNAIRQEPRAAFAQAAEAGVGLIANVPLQSGWLSGKYNAGSRFSDDVRGGQSPERREQMAALVGQVRDILPAGVSLPHGALQYVLAHPQISTVIPGAKSVAQLRDNVAAAHATLPAETVQALVSFGETVPHDLI